MTSAPRLWHIHWPPSNARRGGHQCLTHPQNPLRRCTMPWCEEELECRHATPVYGHLKSGTQGAPSTGVCQDLVAPVRPRASKPEDSAAGGNVFILGSSPLAFAYGVNTRSPRVQCTCDTTGFAAGLASSGPLFTLTRLGRGASSYASYHLHLPGEIQMD